MATWVVGVVNQSPRQCEQQTLNGVQLNEECS
jgi:hypothetical protein